MHLVLFQGTTRLLMTRIPHYKEVILTSFECEHCGNKNSGFQAGQMQDQGVCYELTVEDEEDLQRQVVRSDCATVSVPEVELEIPGSMQKGGVFYIFICISSFNLYREYSRVSVKVDLVSDIDIFHGKW